MIHNRKSEMCPRLKSPPIRTDRQSLWNWVHRFNAAGPQGSQDRMAPRAVSKLTAMQKAELAAIVEAGAPDTADISRCFDAGYMGFTIFEILY